METEQVANKIPYLDKLNLVESHYFSLPSQGNIYTLVPLKYSDGRCKILISSLQKEIYCIEFENGKYLVHENPLTCIPNGSDIVSLNVMRTNKNRFNVGLTLLKDGSSEQCFFNVYMDWDVEKNVCSSQETSTTSSGFSSTKLNFIPYVLFPTTVPSPEGDETVWLISGSDRRIHLYPTSGSSNRLGDEFSSENLFPEFTKVQGITLHLDIHYDHQRKSRFTLTSGESGNVHLFNVDVSIPESPKVISSQKVQFDFPSSAVKLFYAFNIKADIETGLDADNIFESKFSNATKPLALITTTLESCFVHRAEDLDETAFELSESENFDVVTSCLVCDIDFDGINEIVLGTYGQVVLIYKLVGEKMSNWELIKTVYFPSPVLALAYEDILGDGIKELIVSTMAGVHVYQTDPEDVVALIIERLKKLKAR